MYSSKYGMTISQRTVDKKNTDAKAILDMIASLNLKNTILTWDANYSRTSTLDAVIEADTDFVAYEKENQGHLYEEIADTFGFTDKDMYKGEILSSKRVSSLHGRIESKEISIIFREDALSTPMRKKWSSVKSVIRVRTSRVYKSSSVDSEDFEDRYFISSICPDGLDASFANTMQDIILSRWQIESRHWVIDVAFGQDAIPLRNKEYIENSTIYTKIAYNILSYIRDNVPYYNSALWFFASLQQLSKKADVNFMFLKHF